MLNFEDLNTAIPIIQQREGFTKSVQRVHCKYPMSLWTNGVCGLNHNTEDHETISQRCRASNVEAAKRLMAEYPNDEKLRKALIDGGWLEQESQEKT